MCDYKGVEPGDLVVTEKFFASTAVVVTQMYTCDKISQNYTHTHKTGGSTVNVNFLVVKGDETSWAIFATCL